MWKTLGCLVVAMTGTSVMLGWMDPANSVTDPMVSEFEIAALVRESVDSGFSADSEHAAWREVEVAPVRHMPAVGSLLAASRGPLDYHFYVDRFGRPMKTVQWRRQQPIPGRDGVIRIDVEPTTSDEMISNAQHYCVRQLIETLSGSLASDGTPLAVHWPQGWGEATRSGHHIASFATH